MDRDVLVFNELEIDRTARQVRLRGEPVDISDLGFALLERLARAAPDPVSNAELARDVWQADHVADHTIAQRVNIVRRALGDSGEAPRYLRTVRTKGYALIAPAGPPEPARLRKRPRIGVVIAAVIVLVVGLYFLAPGDRPVPEPALTGDSNLPDRLEPPPVLVDPETDALRIDNPDARLAVTAFADVGGRAVLIAGLPDPSIALSHPDAHVVLCALRNDRSMFTSGVDPALSDYLNAEEVAERCAEQEG